MRCGGCLSRRIHSRSISPRPSRPGRQGIRNANNWPRRRLGEKNLDRARTRVSARLLLFSFAKDGDETIPSSVGVVGLRFAMPSIALPPPKRRDVRLTPELLLVWSSWRKGSCDEIRCKRTLPRDANRTLHRSPQKACQLRGRAVCMLPVFL